MISLCNLWSNENVKWKDSNWTWDECELVEEICNLWSTEDALWKNANWTWNKCKIVPIIECPKWGTSGIWWHHANWKWSQCETIPPEPPHPPEPPTGSASISSYYGVDATTLVQPWLEEPWNPYKNQSENKQRKLIKLICKVKNQQYNEEKEIKNFNVTIGDIRMVVKSVSNIDLNLKLE